MINLLPVPFFTIIVILPAVWGFGFPVTANLANVGIFGGGNIAIEEAPFVVEICLKKDDVTTYKLGAGTIIHERFILTAASCASDFDAEVLKVLVGSDFFGVNGDYYRVEQKFCHPDYMPRLDNDICLLRLSSPLEFGATVAKVELPVEDLELKEGTMVNVTGYGATDKETDDLRMLRQVAIPVVANERCRQTYPGPVSDTMLCAGETGHTYCYGDGGGPLTQQHMVVGVVADGFQQCGASPGVYTRVSRYRQWIDDTIANNL